MITENSPVGKVAVESGMIYIRPAGEDKEVRQATERLLQSFGVMTEFHMPSHGAYLPEKLADGFPKGDKQAFLYAFTPSPWAGLQGSAGTLDARKAKDTFSKLDGKDITLRDLATALMQSIKFEAKEMPAAARW
jgi:hypothetical protein